MQFLQLCNAGEDSEPECQLFSFTRTKVVYVQFDVFEKQMRIPFSVCDCIYIYIFFQLICFLSPSPFSFVSPCNPMFIVLELFLCSYFI